MDFCLPEELQMLQATVRRFVEQEMIPLERETPEAEDIPESLRRKLEDKAQSLGLWALDAPVEYGGAGLGELAMSVVLEELACTTLLPFRAPSVFGGYNGTILYHANPDQKECYLKPVIQGKKHASFALTEPNGGSDPSQMRTRAVRDGDYWVITGEKVFISNADRADFIQLFAATEPEKGSHGGVTCFLIDRGTPGMKISRKFDLMIPEKPCAISFQEVRIPDTQRVGEIGEGFKLSQKWLTVGRLRHGPKAVGVARRALQLATEYSRSRVTFGKPLSERQAIQWMLADSAVDIHAARLMIYHAAWRYDNGYDIRQEASMVKLFSDEMAFKVVDRAMQIFGATGLSKDWPIERMFRDIRSRRITEGASEIQRFVIARGLLLGQFPGSEQYS